MHQCHAILHKGHAMNWDNLKVILAIGREKSLTRAARVLGVNQSTVSRKLFALEADLGTILFVRSKSGFAPTAAGEAALRRAAEIEASNNQLIDDISAAETGVVGTVRLIGNNWTLRVLAGHALGGLLAKHPRLDIRMIGRAPGSQTRGEATISLWFEETPNDGEYSLTLGRVPYGLYQSVDSRADEDKWVMFLDEEADRPEIAHAANFLGADEESLRLTATDADTLHGAVAAGIGKGLLPMCVAENDPRLVRSRPGSGQPEFFRDLKMHVSPDTVQTRRMQATMKWLRDSFSGVFLPR